MIRFRIPPVVLVLAFVVRFCGFSQFARTIFHKEENHIIYSVVYMLKGPSPWPMCPEGFKNSGSTVTAPFRADCQERRVLQDPGHMDHANSIIHYAVPWYPHCVLDRFLVFQILTLTR